MNSNEEIWKRLEQLEGEIEAAEEEEETVSRGAEGVDRWIHTTEDAREVEGII